MGDLSKSDDLVSISMSISILEKKTTSYHASRVRTAVVAFRTAPTLVSEGKLLAFRAVYSLQSCKGYTKHIVTDSISVQHNTQPIYYSQLTRYQVLSASSITAAQQQ